MLLPILQKMLRMTNVFWYKIIMTMLLSKTSRNSLMTLKSCFWVVVNLKKCPLWKLSMMKKFRKFLVKIQTLKLKICPRKSLKILNSLTGWLIKPANGVNSVKFWLIMTELVNMTLLSLKLNIGATWRIAW